MSVMLRILQFYATLASTRAKGMYTSEHAERLELDSRSIRRWAQQLNELVEMEPPNLPFELPMVRLTRRNGRSWIELTAQPDPSDRDT